MNLILTFNFWCAYSFRYLWPGYDDDSTNYHVLVAAIIATVKSRENLPVWSEFSFLENPYTFADFSRYFYR